MPDWQIAEGESIELREQVTTLADALRNEQDLALSLQESLADLELAMEDRGWLLLGLQSAQDFTRAGLKRILENSELTLAANPLARRSVQLRTAYIWGQGVSIAVDDSDPPEGGDPQDVNAIVQAFLDRNKAIIHGAEAHEDLERRLATAGEIWYCLPTDQLDGDVSVRIIEPDEITDIIANPEDRQDVWFYERTYVRSSIEDPKASTTVTAYYPSIFHRPEQRISRLRGHEVLWDQPIRAMIVNRPTSKSTRGLGDLYSALPWIRASKEVLEAWVLLFKALARYAYKRSPKGDRAQVAAAEERAAALQPKPAGNPTGVGATYIGGTQDTLEAVNKSGAMIDANGARPVQMMVSAAMGIPITMLLGDPGITGARATAETLDEPTGLVMNMRRDQHAEVLADLISYQIDWKIRTGGLKGSINPDGTLSLAGDQDRTVAITFPDFDSTSVKEAVEAIAVAAGEEVMPKALLLRLLLEALKIDDIDTIMDENTDDEGRWIDVDGDAQQRRDDQGGASGDVRPGEEEPDGDQPEDSGRGTPGPDRD